MEDAAPKRFKRSRNGCATCREKHIRCDEDFVDGACGYCRKNNRTCDRAIKIAFRNLTGDNISSGKRVSMVGIPKEPPLEAQQPRRKRSLPDGELSRINTQNIHFESYIDPQIQRRHSMNDHHRQGPYETVGQMPIVAVDPQADLPDATEFEDGFQPNLHWTVPSCKSTLKVPGPYQNPVDYILSPIDKQTARRRMHPEMLRLLKQFCDQPGPWNDLFDEHQAFSNLAIHKALTFEPLLRACVAMGARYLNVVSDYEDRAVWQLYNDSISATLRALEQQVDVNDVGSVLAMLVTMAQFEMFTASNATWQRHLKGTSELFLAHKVNATTSSDLLARGAFITHARMDTVSAMISNGTTLIDPDLWGINMDYSAVVPDQVYAQRCTKILADVINYSSRIHEDSNLKPNLDHNKISKDLDLLDAAASKWHDNTPETCQIAAEVEERKKAFPTIWYTTACSAAGAYQYHTLRILLLNLRISLLPPRTISHHPYRKTQTKDGNVMYEKLEMKRYQHARQVVGICATNMEPASRVHSVPFLAIAGRYLLTPHEREEMIRIMASIELETGWATKGRRGELLDLWTLVE